MKFEVDKQTLNDLEILGTSKNRKSVFTLFNFTKCLGGEKKLYSYLSSPLTDLATINERKEAIKFFHQQFAIGFQIPKDALDFTEYYFRHTNFAPRLVSKYTAMERMIMDKINPSEEYYLVEKGVESTVELLKEIYKFSQRLSEALDKGSDKDKYPALLIKNSHKSMEIFADREFQDIINMGKIKYYHIAKLDYIFRRSHKASIQFFLNMIYEYDALLSVAKAAEKYNLCYPDVLDRNQKSMKIEGLFHPFLENAISSDLEFNSSANLLFISGPNMGGKSTVLKALGIAVYLAHLGFPVPASKMKVSQLSGICTTINIADNINQGYSHFYAEVMRIKHVASRLKENNNMLVIFDELFRGTNVKDAYDGTLAVVSAFSKIDTSFFVISTHIVEVAKELQNNEKLKFSYTEVLNEDETPIYTYKLKDGISDVRLGMYIINKEKLIEEINDITNKDLRDENV